VEGNMKKEKTNHAWGIGGKEKRKMRGGFERDFQQSVVRNVYKLQLELQ
jgi:hypothetical protein